MDVNYNKLFKLLIDKEPVTYCGGDIIVAAYFGAEV